MKTTIFVLVLLVIPSVLSYSLAKGNEIVYFEPGLEKTIPFVIDNSDGPTTYLRVIALTRSDELANILDQVVHIREPQVTIKEGEKRELYVDVKMPEGLSYGLHEITIRVFSEIPPEEQQYASVVVRTALAFKINIYSLYPGKYMNGLLLSPGSANLGENVFFTTIARNIGTEDIENCRVRIDVYSGNNIVESVYSNYVPVPSKGEQKINVVFSVPYDFTIGEYTAKSIIEYDGKTEEARYTHRFNIGELSMSILNITSRVFQNNQINQFDIEVESKWNKPIDVYADVIVTDFSGNEIAKFKTPTATVDGWQKEIVPAYVNMKDIVNDNYMLKIVLYYGDKTSRRTFAVGVSDVGEAKIVDEMPGMPKESVIIILLSTVIVLLVIIVLMMFFRRKKVVYNEIR